MLLTVARILSKFTLFLSDAGLLLRLVKRAEYPYDTALFL
jgi:hypothetical protein